MVQRALRGTSWSHLIDYASPALFDVIPTRALLAQSRELLSNRGNKERFAQVREATGALLRERGIDAELVDRTKRAGGRAHADLPLDVRSELGERILKIYFTQVFRSPDALLDLRAEKVATTERGGLFWQPGALYLRWQPDFLEGVRGLYYGFYLRDATRFDAALETLGMADSGDALRNLLGRDDPHNARFNIDEFHASFHELFVSYRVRGVALHRNFLPLGVCLMCLYDTLDGLGTPLNVLAAVEHALA
jgi:hypothetical protein